MCDIYNIKSRKHIVCAVLLFFAVISAKAQDIPPDQEISVTKFTYRHSTWDVSGDAGIELTFDFKFKYFTDDYQQSKYPLDLYFITGSGDTLPGKFNSLARAKSYDDGYDKGIRFFIAYQDMPFPPGPFLLNFSLDASHEDVRYRSVYYGAIKGEIPKLFDYEEQQFTLSKVKMTPAVSGTVRGVKVEFRCNFLFPEAMIKKNRMDKNEDLAYYFYVSIKDPSGNPVAQPDDNPKEEYGGSDYNLYSRSVALEKGKYQEMSIFVPYAAMDLLQGDYRLALCIGVTAFERMASFGTIWCDSVNVLVPDIYLVDVSVKNILIADGEYDVAGKNIPIVNLFTGKKRGKGYPDVRWSGKHGQYYIYSSAVASNSLQGHNGSFRLKACDGENISVFIYDRDILSRHDPLGTFSLPDEEGAFSGDSIGVRRNNVSSVDVSFSKVLLPTFGDASLETAEKIIHGASGILITAKLPYAASANLALSLTPICFNAKMVRKKTLFYDPDSLMEIKEIPLTGNRLSYSWFIPYASTDFDFSPGASISLSSGDLTLKTFLAKGTFGRKKANDIQFNKATATKVVVEGVAGLLLEFNPLIKGIYRKMLEKDKLSVVLNVRTASEKPYAMQKTFNPMITSDFSVFVPFVDLWLCQPQGNLTAFARVVTRNNAFEAGIDTIDFPVTVTGIHHTSFSAIDTKMKKETEGYFIIQYAGKTIDSLSLTTPGKISVFGTTTFRKFYHHEEDIVKVIFMIPSSYTSGYYEVWSQEFNGKEFTTTGVLKLSKNSWFKKGVLKYSSSY